MKRLSYLAVGLVCLVLGVRLGLSANPYKDVICEDVTESDLAYQLANWSPMHTLDRDDIRHSISDEFPTLGCKAYVMGWPFEFTANQRWIKRSDQNIKFKRKR